MGDVMRRQDGTLTADVVEQLTLVLNAWRPIFERFRQGEPDENIFFDLFGQHIRGHRPPPLDPLTGARLVKFVLKMFNFVRNV